MQPEFYFSQANGFTASARSRIVAVLLSLAVVALILFTLIQMGLVSLGTSGSGARLASVNLAVSGAAQKAAKPHASSHHQSSQPQPQLQPEQAQPKPHRLLWLSHDEFAAADIAHMARQNADTADAGGQISGSTYGPGEGPGGAQLLNAAWYREPSHGELAGYLPSRVEPGSWATIACRTVANFHVEDCRELDESPPGSGLSRALRRAAWQFLVRPPRVNGEAKLGGWVRIRFDFTRNTEG